MALLHYANLEEHRPEVLMQKTFSGLQDFYSFLENTKRYLESDKSVKRLSWQPMDGTQEDNLKRKHSRKGIWIQLIEAEGSSDDSTFKSFLDENNSEVYEANSTNWKFIASPAIDCPRCTLKNKKPKLAYQTREHAEEVASQSRIQLDVYKCEHGYGWHLTKQIRIGNISFSKEKKLTVIDRDVENERLFLDRLPSEKYLVLRPNTYTLRCQLNALKELQDSPSTFHRPLLRLFESTDHARWGQIGSSFGLRKWFVLTDADRPGTTEQRKFVETALQTPDFAFLEGPPGSGKTTAILELIIQLALRGQRILLCASTHVAVDNVLERILEESDEIKNAIIALRIGEQSNLSDKVKPYQLEEFLRTERSRLLSALSNLTSLSPSQQELLAQLQTNKNTVIQRMVLESANLVCGTTIGILQHPDIRAKGEAKPQFDYMIIDEASKTTFQEFLVPALLAKRWVLVGDQKQLSPYVDDEATAINIEPCLPELFKRNACLDIFYASSNFPAKQRISSLISSGNKHELDFYQKQAVSNSVLLSSPKENNQSLPYASIVIGDTDFIESNTNSLPLDLSRYRGDIEKLNQQTKYRMSAFLSSENKRITDNTWESELSWRLSRLYEQRHNLQGTSETRKSTSEKLKKQIDSLLPHDGKSGTNSVFEGVNRVRRVALPSVLESLQSGFERKANQRQGTALSDGLPAHVINQRAVTLTFQHRMHPDIADFSSRVIYQGKALQSPMVMESKRAWDYQPDRKRSTWFDVKGFSNHKTNSNKYEAEAIMNELLSFDKWAKENIKEDGKPWEVALLTFYRGQERELRFRLQNWTRNRRSYRHFKRGDAKAPYLDIQVCTVDRFQGHEADLVLLSFTKNHATSFLESPNRLNVAITRARYGLVVFGARNAMKKASGVLATYADEAVYSKEI